MTKYSEINGESASSHTQSPPDVPCRKSGPKPDKSRTRRSPEERRRAASEKAAAKYQAELARDAERAVARLFQEDGLDWLEGRDTEGARRFAAAIDQKREAVKASRVVTRPSHAGALKAVRNAERLAGDGTDISGTGYTILKMRQKPLTKLIEADKIGPEELQAAQEISIAFVALSNPVAVRSMSLDRVDCGRQSGDAWPEATMRAIRHYQPWAKYWTRRNDLLCDPMLEVIISAVVDENSIRQIAADIERHHSRVEQGVIWGLRDYAARAGFVSGGKSQAWIAKAEQVFASRNEKLAVAIHRAMVER